MERPRHFARGGKQLARLVCMSVFAFVVAAGSVSAHAAHPVMYQHGGPNQGYLGIEFHDCTDPKARGAEIVMVDHDGPAGKAGLRPHDIITSVNGQLIDSAQTLRRLIHEAGANVQIALQVVRFGKPLTLNAKLADRTDVEREAMQRLAAAPEDVPPPPVELSNSFVSRYAAEPSLAPAPASAAASSKASLLKEMLHATPFTGVAMEAMEPQLAGFFGAPTGTGLLVNTVLPNSPAANAGLHAGDVILRADAITLKTPADWTRHLRAAHGSAMQLVVLRDKQQQTLTLIPDLKRKSELGSSSEHITA